MVECLGNEMCRIETELHYHSVSSAALCSKFDMFISNRQNISIASSVLSTS